MTSDPIVSHNTRWAMTTTLMLIVGILVAVQNADAKMLGGSRGFARQFPSAPHQQTFQSMRAPVAQAAHVPLSSPPGQVQPPRNRWLGPIAGLAAGFGIAALMSHFGMGGALGGMLSSILMIGVLAFLALVIWRLLTSKRDSLVSAPPIAVDRAFRGTSNSTNQDSAFRANSTDTPDQFSTQGLAQPNDSATLPSQIPDGFEEAAFLRTAKVAFNRLQAAWNSKNLTDIREFTTPEVYGEIKTQIEEDLDVINRNEVFNLDAQLLGLEPFENDYLASVRFSGTCKETALAAPEAFVQIWNLAKRKDGSGEWLFAGFQQAAG